MLRLIPAPLHRLLYRLADRTRRLWWRVRRPQRRSVLVAAFDGEGRVLLARHSYGPPVWALPGGGVGKDEDPELAAWLGERMVAIKVDREEHPEVDAAYLAAASAFTSNLGWPLTAFATPQVDFASWARALGARAECIERPGQITRELLDSLTEGGCPAVLDVRIDPSIRIRGDGRIEAIAQMSMLNGGSEP